MPVDPDDELPASLLLDTTVFLRALGHKVGDPRTRACAHVLETALSTRRRVLIGAPTAAEIHRGKPDDGASPRPFPRVANFLVAPFDERCAQILGEKLPQAELVEFAVNGLAMTHLKFDSMLVAIAIRYGAACIISLDGGMQDRYGKVLPVYNPARFLPKQVPLVEPKPKPKPDQPSE